MARRRLFWQIYPSYLVVTILSLTAVIWYAFQAYRDSSLENTTAELSARVHLISDQLLNELIAGTPHQLDSVAKEMGRLAATRITVVSPSGLVLADSEDDPAKMDNHGNRPEIHDALAGRTGVATRYSYTLFRTMVYMAIPLYVNGKITAILRVSVPLNLIAENVRRIELKIAIVGIVVALMVAMITLYVSRGIVRPIEEIGKGAEKFSRGDLSGRLSVPETIELAGLAEALNEMAAMLANRIDAMATQGQEREAILSSMVEGVFAVDREERIISINRAAARMMSVEQSLSPRRGLEEILRNYELLSIVKESLRSESPIEREIIMARDEENYFQAHSTPLLDAAGKNVGALIVLNDITQLKKLENIRRDFVANVSHELKTPLTTIKGFVETLLGGAMQKPEDTIRFLMIIDKQIDRLNSIIEDLLSLSRIEKEVEKGGITLENRDIMPVLQASIQTCQAQAAAKSIRIGLSGDKSIRGAINPTLLEQAVMNLIDNAVKFSNPDSVVNISLGTTAKEITIQISDHGCGIEREHIPRLFERFYRVDKSRSRTPGGTGLGLAIAKHIVLAHHGRIAVESTPGKGSIFTVFLPLN